MQECFKRAEDRILWLLDVESLPFTLNQHYLSDYKTKFLAYYQEARPDGTREKIAREVKIFRGGAATVKKSVKHRDGEGVVVSPLWRSSRVVESLVVQWHAIHFLIS